MAEFACNQCGGVTPVAIDPTQSHMVQVRCMYCNHSDVFHNDPQPPPMIAAADGIPRLAPMGANQFNPNMPVTTVSQVNFDPQQLVISEVASPVMTQTFNPPSASSTTTSPPTKGKSSRKKNREAGFSEDGLYEVDAHSAILPHVYGLRQVRYRCECDGSGSKQVSPTSGTRISCANHSSPNGCTGRTGRKHFKVCVTCEMVMCAYCAGKMHSEQLFPDCYTMPLTFVHAAQRLFIEMNARGQVGCTDIINKVADFRDPGTKPDKESSMVERCVTIAMKRAMSRFGDSYRVTLKEFLELYSAYMISLRDPTAKPDDVAANEFNALGACGQRLLDLQLWWRYRDSKGSCLTHLTRIVEARRGGNVAQYFSVLNWLLSVNLALSIIVVVLIMLPPILNGAFDHIPYQWKGVILGETMEATPLFYSGYFSNYQSPSTSWHWKMDRIWLPVQISLLLVSLLAVMGSISTEAMAESRAHESARGARSLIGTLFAGIRHTVPTATDAAFNRQMMVVKLDTSLELKKLPQPDPSKRRGCSISLRFLVSAYVIYGLLSYALIVAYVAGIYWLVALAPSDVAKAIPEPWNALIIPVLVCLSKFIVPPILKWFASREFRSDLYSRSFVQSRYYWRVLATRVLSLVVMVFSVMRTSPLVPINYTPFSTSTQTLYDPNKCVCPSGSTLSCPDGNMLCVCPEAALGTFYYRLLLVDFVLSILYSFSIAPLRVVAKSICSCCRDNRALFAAAATPQAGSPSLRRVPDTRRGSAQRGRSAVVAPLTRTSSSVALVSQRQLEYDNSVNNPFEPMHYSADAIYRQTIIWAGVVYAPVLPIMGFILGFLHFMVKFFEAKYFMRRDTCLQTPSQQRLSVQLSLIVVIIITFVPISYFTTRTSSCGPFYNTSVSGDTIGETLVKTFDQFPGWLRVIAGYFSNTIVLWMIIVFAMIFVLTMRRQFTVASARREDLDLHLDQEIRERNRLVNTLKNEFSARKRKSDQNPWVQWIQELHDESAAIDMRNAEYCTDMTEEEMADYYFNNPNYTDVLQVLPSLQTRVPDFVDLLRMRDDQLLQHLVGLNCSSSTMNRIIYLVNRKRTMRFEAQAARV